MSLRFNKINSVPRLRSKCVFFFSLSLSIDLMGRSGVRKFEIELHEGHAFIGIGWYFMVLLENQRDAINLLIAITIVLYTPNLLFARISMFIDLDFWFFIFDFVIFVVVLVYHFVVHLE